jgi:hypothetical protein
MLLRLESRVGCQALPDGNAEVGGVDTGMGSQRHQETGRTGRPEARHRCAEARRWCAEVAAPDGDTAVAAGAPMDREAGCAAPAWDGQ